MAMIGEICAYLSVCENRDRSLHCRLSERRKLSVSDTVKRSFSLCDTASLHLHVFGKILYRFWSTGLSTGTVSKVPIRQWIKIQTVSIPRRSSFVTVIPKASNLFAPLSISTGVQLNRKSKASEEEEKKANGAPFFLFLHLSPSSSQRTLTKALWRRVQSLKGWLRRA